MPQPASKVLVLRLAERLEETLEACRKAGLDPLPQSYGTIVSRETFLPANINGIIVTSTSTLESLPATPLPIYCVGEATAKRLRARGFHVHSHAAPDAKSLVTYLFQNLPPQTLLHLCGEEAETEAFAKLSAAGFKVLRQTSYHIAKSEGLDPLVLWHLQQNQVTLGMVFSPQSGELLRRLLAENGFDKPFPLVVISQKAAKAFADWPQVRIAEAPTEAAMIAAATEQIKG